MLKFVTKDIIKYLIILVLTFFVGIMLFFVAHVLLENKVEKYTQKHALISSYIKNANQISSSIIEIKANIFEITAAALTLNQRKILNQNVKKSITDIRYLTKELGSNFKDSEKFLLELESIDQSNTILMQILATRDLALNKNKTNMLDISKKIRQHNHAVPSRIQSILSYVKKVQDNLEKEELKCQKTIKDLREKYEYLELFIGVVIVFITLYLSKLISNRIVRLYRRLEKQLYTDDLTQLKNRLALHKTYEDAQKPIIIIMNIDLFREINELYGTDIGNDVLKKLATVMDKYFSDTNFELFRIAGDEFVLFEEGKEYSYPQMEKVILDFLLFIKENKIYIKEISENIELDFTCGVSTCIDNPLGKADIALNFAKKNGLPFALYKKDIDNKVELKHNIFWNKEIQKGIKKDMFLPFFQPIVDRDGKVKKYESLMRLKRKNEKEVTCESPLKFLDIAKKTKNYNAISSMTIFKTLEVCKETGAIITINLDKSDMKNSYLSDALKDKIIELDIADKIIFEILENENIVDNKMVKEFITEFRKLGVMFAIDDFGSGYSNFSFILDIKPDFIKIDGSLVKNISEDKNSYELVKSIVAFAKALNIITIAEFVHSKEVYDIVLDLGVDQFQGYYFGEPKNKCF